MKRRTVSLSDAALEALDRIARQHATTVSGVVEGAALALRDGGPGARAVERHIVADRRGGDQRAAAVESAGGKRRRGKVGPK